MSRRPNILIVLTDQMRSTALGCADVEAVLTPHLDRFAGQGTRFANAVSNTPACAPARASLLTGLHVLSHGVINNEMSLRTDVTSLAHAFSRAGYACAYIGKWHVDGVNRGAYIPPGPRRQGFDDSWAGTECNHQYFAGYYYDDATRAPVWFDEYEPEGQTALAEAYLQKRADQEDPFCLVLSWGPPHCPYRKAPRAFLDMYPPESIELLPNAGASGVLGWDAEAKAMRPRNLSVAEARHYQQEQIAGYYAHVSALDACFGRLMERVDALGLSENTLVVFTSDHGDMLFSHDRGWKTKPWREAVGIPLLMRWPGEIPSERVTRLPISLADLMPTLLGLAGAEIPAAVEGQDLSACVRGDENGAPFSQWINFPCVPLHYRHSAWRGVVTRTHTYVETRDGPWLLYDDMADPFQMQNLVGRSEQADLQARLHEEVRAWLERTQDPFLSTEAMADRFMPGHETCEFPIPPLEPVIREGQQARAQRVY